MTIGGKGVIMRGTLIVIQGASEESAAVMRKAAREMLYFSLLYLYGTNDDWRKGCHNEGNVNRHPECEGSITVMRASVSIGSSFAIEAISACEYLQSPASYKEVMMRRNDREITEETEIRKVLDECKIVHLGFQDGGRVFVVPVNYGYSYEGGKLTVYFHGADAGLKRELAESNPVIGFEIDNGGVMGRAEKACDYTEYYHSIIGSGPVSVVKDREEKKKILTIFMECQDKKHFEFTDRMAAHVAVYKIEADEFACKEHNM